MVKYLYECAKGSLSDTVGSNPTDVMFNQQRRTELSSLEGN